MGDFKRVPALADYYRALPMVSLSLDRALLDSQLAYEHIRDNAVKLFELAAKLRNARLFREALIWLVGDYENPSHGELSDPKLRMIAGWAYGEIARKVALVTNKLLILNSSSEKTGGGWLQRIRHELYASFRFSIDPAIEQIDDFMLIAYPRYFRHVWSAEKRDEKERLPDVPLLREVLENKLILSGTSLRLGEGKIFE